MPKKRVRLTTRGSYTKDQVQNAVHAVESGMSVRAAGREFGIAESTIRLRMKTRNIESAILGRKPTFTFQQEAELTEYIWKVANLFYGLTPLEVRKIAFEYAEANNIPHNFCRVSQLAGKDWLSLFLKRNPRISLRTPEATSIARISGFNKESVNIFFNNLEKLMEEHHFPRHRIYNVDETGISNVQKPVRVLAPKGQKQVGCVTSGERGKNVTVVCAGNFVPPMFIFPRLRMSPHLQHGGPVGAVYACSKNGWINEDLSLDWLQHFARNTKPTKADPILLILDNHGSHISMHIYEFCKENGITLLSIPPHTSHKLQPLDVAFYGPLKAAFNRECTISLKKKSISPSHVTMKITQYELAELFNKAYSKVAMVEKGVSGFSTAGISPINPDKFSETDFYPCSDNLDLQVEVAEEETEKEDDRHNVQAAVAGTSTSFPAVPLESAPKSSAANSKHVKVADLHPLPTKVSSSSRKSSKAKCRKQSSEILTGTPMKAKLQEAEKRRETTKRRKEEKAQKENKTVEKKSRRKSCKRKLDFSDGESDADEFSEKQLCDDDENDDVAPINYDVCCVCDEFGRDNEMWYRCVGCGRWSHEECSGWDSAENYFCDLCLRKQKQF